MLDAEQAIQEKNYRLPVKITAAVLIIVVAVGIFEVLARFVFAYREDIQASPFISGILQRTLDLDPYEMASPLGGYHWVLRPGYKATTEKLVDLKKEAGRDLGAVALQAGIRGLEDKRSAVFQVNANGFKGPELDRTHTRPRILALGDSTTFGIGAMDYPRSMEVSLNRRGIPVEVVNGGVEGYSSQNVLNEIERYKALKPEIVTLYIGWNSLFFYVPWKDAWENRLRIVWLYKRASRTLRAMIGNPQAFANKMYNRSLTPDLSSPEVKRLRDYTPPFMDKIESLIDEIESVGTRVVVVTLPGLFTISADPSPEALKIGHLPQFTENPFVLAKLTERYNIALRALAKRRDLGLVDLEEWSVQALRPREAFFSDSVHLTPRGLDMIGAFMADKLANQILINR